MRSDDQGVEGAHMALPESARARLAAVLQNAEPLRSLQRIHNTLPIGLDAWRRQCEGLVAEGDELVESCCVPAGGYTAILAWAESLLRLRRSIRSVTLALEPFVPFDRTRADELFVAVDEVIRDAARQVLVGSASSKTVGKLRRALSWWRSYAPPHDEVDLYRLAFGVPTTPLDERGEFRADWVLRHYVYRNGELWQRLLPHLQSLGIGGVSDALVGISVIGAILGAEEPCGAYTAMESFIGAYAAAPPALAEEVAVYLEASEPALTRSRKSVAQLLVQISNSTDRESQALGLADAYARLVEGPFRHHAWAVYCLKRGHWGPTPMLFTLRERLLSSTSALSQVAERAILPALRNSVAHQTLVWDGAKDEFVTEEGTETPQRVALATVASDAFARGCEAGFAAVRSLVVEEDAALLPAAGERGRMAAWRRACAFFGTNGLEIAQESLNARHATVRVERLRERDINPCFQALVTAHSLLPEVTSFTVETSYPAAAAITVEAAALTATVPIWSLAVAALNRMPFSTFLPANYDARRGIEGENVALRSVAWIAVDDALDAIDGQPSGLNGMDRDTLVARLAIVERAIEQLISYAGRSTARLDSVLSSVRSIREWIEGSDPRDLFRTNQLAEIGKLRTQWSSWGPAPRHPLVMVDEHRESEPRPLKHPRPLTKAYRSI